MAKLTLDEITSGYASVAILNNNFTAIETALENTLSRDGTTPNQMTADLDMNSNDILNAGDISATDVIVNGQSFSTAVAEVQAASADAQLAADVATSVAALVSTASCCLDSTTSFFDFGLITDTAVVFPTDFGSVV